MLDDKFNKERAELIRKLATIADPFIKRRLDSLVSRYEQPRTPKRLPLVSIGDQQRGDRAESV